MSRIIISQLAGPFRVKNSCGVFFLFATLLPAISVSAQIGLPEDELGIPSSLGPGRSETVSEIMARDKNLPLPSYLKPGQSDQGRLLPNRHNLSEHPASPHSSAWPAGPKASSSGPSSEIPLVNAQSLGVSFLGAQISEAGFIPPDSMAAVGPSQVLMCVNGRIKVFDKTGVVGALNTTSDNFFNSQTGNGTSDPRVRYDPLSGRWFVVMIDIPRGRKSNKILIAVSSGPNINGQASFTFFSFNHSAVSGGGDTGFFADYPTLGIDNNALYIGANMFSGNTYEGTSGYIVTKTALLAGTLNVTAFRQLASASGPGPFTPQGVDNDDPLATQGFFIGVDNASKGLLVLRRISNPGGVPSISANLNLTVPDTAPPAGGVPALGSSVSLDALDDRLFAARMHKGRLWAAHNLEVNSTGVADELGGRIGSRWYEITNVTETPGLRQSGTLFDPNSTGPGNYWIPSCTMNGQGHMLLGCSVAWLNEHAEIAIAGRFTSDPLGSLQSPAVVQGSTSDYNIADNSNPHRWGDYSLTTIDPNDDMTFWTVQEYCNANNSWGVRIMQIKAPPPATPVLCLPASLPAGASNITVSITGLAGNGSGFFDPGPGFPNHLAFVVNGGGVVVNSLTYIDPTHVSLNISISDAASSGSQTLTAINPDGQTATSASGLLTITTSTPVNHAPVLAAIPSQVIDEQNLLLVTNVATDVDSPPGLLTFSLQGAPEGAVIAPATGLFSWTPDEAQGPGTHTIRVVVSDNGSPSVSATQSFTVLVREVNQPPLLAPIANQTLHQGSTLIVTNTATDPDLPANVLTFTLSGAPAGAIIDSSSGVFTWTPLPEQVNTTNLITTLVTDDGSPALSDAKAFTAIVLPPPTITSIIVTNSLVLLSWNTIAGKTYRVQASADLSAWSDLPGDVTATGATASKADAVGSFTQRFYRIRVLP